ncbi:hypothetical protein LL946_06070 [Knoellia locipacati]|uniref:hypothetical protein n=1 Tax=Knoellia locipacati TaxID=882824 RepID=UPI00384C2E83
MGDDFKRYWLQVGRSYSLDAHGWLADPNAGSWWQPYELLSTTDLAQSKCVIMLGEPGLGKSTLISLHEGLPPRGRLKSLSFDLAGYASESRIVSEIFGDPAVQTWREGSGKLCLALDSFDEAHRRVPTLPHLLRDFIERGGKGRLYLRIACRTADWPNWLNGELEKLFDETLCVELLPLRRADAAELVPEVTDREAFLTAIEKSKAVPLGARPLTLRLLARAWVREGRLPSRPSDLFEQGLLALCDESNEARRQGDPAIGTATERLDTATRLAALSLFGGRPTFWTGLTAEAGASDLTIDECLRRPTGFGGSQASADLVAATLHSALFTGAGDSRLGWSHSTFVEFLSARWMRHCDLDEEQVASLLVTDNERIPKHLRGVAAWLVATDASRYNWLLDVDPEAFLVDVVIPDDDARTRLVSSILEHARAGRMVHNYETPLDGLGHPGIAHQLSVGLQDSHKDVRRLALDIARAIQLPELKPEFVQLALDPSEESASRVAAALAAQEVADTDPTADLLPLIRQAGGHSSATADDDQELQAAGLFASWPHAITTAEVFAVLVPKHRKNFLGLYSAFVSEFAAKLTPLDTEAAANWLREDLERLNDSRVDALVDKCMELCLNHLNVPGARDAVEEIMLACASNYQPLFRRGDDEPIVVSSAARRELALGILAKATQDQTLAVVDVFDRRDGALLTSADFPWLLRQHSRSSGPLRDNLGLALQTLFNPASARMSSAVLALSERSPTAALFEYWRGAVVLKSDAAVTARESWQKLEAQRRRAEERRTAKPKRDLVARRLPSLARNAGAGDSTAFWQAARDVTVRPGTGHYMDEFQPDLTRHPRWQQLSQETRANLVRGALQYLESASCSPDRWLGKDLRFFPAEAGYKALILLLKVDAPRLRALSAEAWREWAPIMVTWTCTLNGATLEDKEALFALALPHAREALTDSLMSALEDNLIRGQTTHLREEMRLLDSDALAHRLVELISRQATAKDGTWEIVDHLAQGRFEVIRPLLHDWVAPKGRAKQTARAEAAMVRLLAKDADASWPVIRQTMRRAHAFMKRVALAWGATHDRRPPTLAVDALAELYMWLTEHFPAAEDPQFDDAHFVGPRESVGEWRDSILRSIVETGTSQSVEAVRLIVSRLGHGESHAYWLLASEQAYRDKSFHPTSPAELDAIADSRLTRLIRSESELLDACLSALRDIGVALQGDTPTAPLLWDTFSGRPKSEDEFSDYLRSELQWRLRLRGLVVNREVQVKRVKAAGAPERTDLRVDAAPIMPGLASLETRPITIVGEVKGPWNRDLETAPERQLAARYMQDIGSRSGIYIVPWFDQESWRSAGDQRKSKARARGSIKELSATLENVAAPLDARGLDVRMVVLDAGLTRPSSRATNTARKATAKATTGKNAATNETIVTTTTAKRVKAKESSTPSPAARKASTKPSTTSKATASMKRPSPIA